MVDPTKPCVKCKAVNRSKRGDCKNCEKNTKATYFQSDHGRAKIKAYQRKYRQSDEGRAKEREYRQSDQVRARIRDYQRHWCKSDEVRAKQRDNKRKRAQTAIGRQSQYAAKAKYKKTLFEFSLQNQQKVIEQCQQKLTQPNEIS